MMDPHVVQAKPWETTLESQGLKSEFAEEEKSVQPPVAAYSKREFAAADNKGIRLAALPETQRFVTNLDEWRRYSVVGGLRNL